MKIMRNSGFAVSLLLVGTLLFINGCGYKNKPVPPQTLVPKVVEDLRYNVGDKDVTLSWSYPIKTITGKDVNEILAFELYRAEIPLADFCNTCPIPFGKPQEVPGGASVDEDRRTAEFTSGMLKSGNKYFFKVRSRSSWWAASDDSNIVSFVYHTPAAAPVGLQATAGRKNISLSWDKVVSLIDGNPVDLPVRYQVLKSGDNTSFAAIGNLLSTTSFVDEKVITGKEYYYKVESSMLFKDTAVQGSSSKSVLAELSDLEPPKMVTGVRVVAANTNNRIFWDRVKADDLAGYKVYRRVGSEEKATMIGTAGSTQTLFIDENIPENPDVFYSVTAIDTANPANESKRSEEATTRH